MVNPRADCGRRAQRRATRGERHLCLHHLTTAQCHLRSAVQQRTGRLTHLDGECDRLLFIGDRHPHYDGGDAACRLKRDERVDDEGVSPVDLKPDLVREPEERGHLAASAWGAARSARVSPAWLCGGAAGLRSESLRLQPVSARASRSVPKYARTWCWGAVWARVVIG